jgi:hypothetical protein
MANKTVLNTKQLGMLNPFQIDVRPTIVGNPGSSKVELTHPLQVFELQGQMRVQFGSSPLTRPLATLSRVGERGNIEC